jgi:hypothetical protein
MNQKRMMPLIGSLLSGLVVLIGFQNCGEGFSLTEDGPLSSLFSEEEIVDSEERTVSFQREGQGYLAHFKMSASSGIIGNIDGVQLKDDFSGIVIGGWACAHGQDEPLTIEVYTDGVRFPSTGENHSRLVHTIGASSERADKEAIKTACGTSTGHHTFHFELDAQTSRNLGRNLHIYAIKKEGNNWIYTPLRIQHGDAIVPVIRSPLMIRAALAPSFFDSTANKVVLLGWACQVGNSAPIHVSLYKGANTSGTPIVEAIMANGVSGRGVGDQCDNNQASVRHDFRIEIDRDRARDLQGQGVSLYASVKKMVEGREILVPMKISAGETFQLPSLNQSENRDSTFGVLDTISLLNGENGNRLIKVTGWACQKGNPTSLQVNITDSSNGGGVNATVSLDISTDKERTDLYGPGVCDATGRYGFEYTLSAEQSRLFSGKPLYTFAKVPESGMLVALGNSGQTAPVTIATQASLSCNVLGGSTPDRLFMNVDIRPSSTHYGKNGAYYIFAEAPNAVDGNSIYILSSDGRWARGGESPNAIREDSSSGVRVLQASGYQISIANGLDTRHLGGFKVFIGYGVSIDGIPLLSNMNSNPSQAKECYTVPTHSGPIYQWELVAVTDQRNQCRQKTAAYWEYSAFGDCVNNERTSTPRCIPDTREKTVREVKCKDSSTGQYVALSLCPASSRPDHRTEITESCGSENSECRGIRQDDLRQYCSPTHGINTLSCTLTAGTVRASLTPEINTSQGTRNFYFAGIKKGEKFYVNTGNTFVEYGGQAQNAPLNIWQDRLSLNNDLIFSIPTTSRSIVGGGEVLVGYGFGTNVDAAAENMMARQTFKACPNITVPSN